MILTVVLKVKFDFTKILKGFYKELGTSYASLNFPRMSSDLLGPPRTSSDFLGGQEDGGGQGGREGRRSQGVGWARLGWARLGWTGLG